MALLAFALASLPALGASGGAVTVGAKPRVIEYQRSVTVRGHAGHRRGAVVALEANRFPFEDGFVRVARQRTERHGAYAFHRKPGHAVRYRVVRGDAGQSRAATVYVEPRITRRRCNLCGASSSGRGARTVRISFRILYPSDAYPTEAPKRVFFYYGQRDGSSRPPDHLQLAETVRQRRLTHHRTRVRIAHRVHLPNAYRFAVAACTRTSMRVDGIGLPGSPGSHGCGQPRITYRESRRWLG